MKLARPLIVALLTFAVVVSAVAVAAAKGTAAGTGIVKLPPEILLDRHLLRAERLLAAGDPAGALEAMNEILALQDEHDLVLPDDFDFQYAQVAYAAGRTETAIASLNEYLVAAGREGEFYRQALELLDPPKCGSSGRRRSGGVPGDAPKRNGDAPPAGPPGHVFRNCETCPEMVVLPGSPVALGRYEVTLGEYRAFAAATGGGAGGGCYYSGEADYSWRNLPFPQTDRHPVTCMSWDDAQAYVFWLSRTARAPYRLPTLVELAGAAEGSQLAAIGTVQAARARVRSAPTAPTTCVSRTCSGTWWSGRPAAWTATVAAASCAAATGPTLPASSFPTPVPTRGAGGAPPFARTSPVSVSRGRWSSRMPRSPRRDPGASTTFAPSRAFADALHGVRRRQ